MTEPSVSVAGNLADDPEVRSTEAGIAPGQIPGGRLREAGARGVVLHRHLGRDPAEHVAESLGKGSRVVVAEELGRACDGRPPPRPGQQERQRLEWVRHPVKGA